MIKIKIFLGDEMDIIERDFAEFFQDKEKTIHDIRFSSYGTGHKAIRILVLYEVCDKK